MSDPQAILDSVLELGRDLPSEKLPGFLGRLEEIRVTALARLHAPAHKVMADELLDITEAARRLGCTKSFLYHRKSLPFARRVGRSLRFSARGIEEFITSQKSI